MDLEKMNSEYKKLKAKLEQTKNDVNNLEKKANILADDRIIWNGKLKEAERNNDQPAQNVAKAELKRIDDEIKKIQEEVPDKKQDLEEIQGKINDRIEMLKNNPEMKAHLEDVIAKQQQRKLVKEREEKKQLEEKKAKIERIQQLITEHPSLANNLKGMLIAKTDIKKLGKELKDMEEEVNGVIQYKNPTRAQEIQNTLLPQANKKLQDNKNPFMAYVTKNKIDISEKDIDELKVVISKDKNGKEVLDFKATLVSNVASVNRQIKAIDKNIADREMVLVNMQRPYEEQKEEEETTLDSTSEEQVSTPPATIEKPKWWQFRKRFQNWREQRKQEKQTSDKPEEEVEPEKVDVKNNSFKNSLKFEIVQEIKEQVEKESLREAREQRKAIKQAFKNTREEQKQREEEK